MSAGATVSVDARCRLSYSYFYLLGIRHQLVFTTNGFEGLAHIDPFRTLLPLIFGDQRIIVDLGDSSHVDAEAFAWADVYGKVNCTAEQVESGVIPIGPGFGVRPDSLRAVWHTVSTPMPLEGVKAGLAERRNLWFRAAPLSHFRPGAVQPDYLFSVNSLWEWAQTQETTNQWRALWMRVARDNPLVRFDGGFVPRPNSELGPPQGPQEQEFADLLMPGRISIGTWIKRTQQSFAVLNTPAVYECHGWKLGQYLALGKAIVTTPLSRELPAPLLHGQHVHMVENPEDLAPAMELLRCDSEYREHLQRQARQYWLTHLRPEVVMRRLTTADPSAGNTTAV